MANYTQLHIQGNDNTDGSPNWVPGGGSPTAGLSEIRWGSAGISANTASASWPLYDRDASVTVIPMVYQYTADAVGNNYDSYTTASPITHILQNRIYGDNTGTMGSAPIITGYPTTAHGSITPGDGSLLGGHATDTSSTSYLKGAAYGQNSSSASTWNDAPGAAPGGSVTGTTGSAGAIAPSNGTSWSAWQSLQGDTQYLQSNNTPTAASATSGFLWYFVLRLYNGPNMTTGTLVPVASLRYTYT